jgi:hypothetical protein
MKNENWAYKYGPPSDELPQNDHGWPQSWLMLAFVVVGPLIYFGPELRTIEAWLVAACRTGGSWFLVFMDGCSADWGFCAMADNLTRSPWFRWAHRGGAPKSRGRLR